MKVRPTANLLLCTLLLPTSVVSYQENRHSILAILPGVEQATQCVTHDMTAGVEVDDGAA